MDPLISDRLHATVSPLVLFVPSQLNTFPLLLDFLASLRPSFLFGSWALCTYGTAVAAAATAAPAGFEHARMCCVVNFALRPVSVPFVASSRLFPRDLLCCSIITARLFFVLSTKILVSDDYCRAYMQCHAVLYVKILYGSISLREDTGMKY